MMKVIVSNQPGTTKGEIEILKVFAQIWGDMIWWQQCHCGGKASTTTRCVRLSYLLIVFLLFLSYISVFRKKCISRIWKIWGEVIWWQQCRSSHRYETCKSPLPALLKTHATSQYFWSQVEGGPCLRSFCPFLTLAGVLYIFWIVRCIVYWNL